MPRPLRALFVEDSPDDADLIADALAGEGFEVTSLRVDDLPSLETALQQRWDVALIDHSLPRLRSHEAMRAVQERDPDLPLIIVSGTISELDAVNAMRSGAHDYLLKHNLTRLGAVIDREVAETIERRKQREARERMRYLALFDEGTGLPNRAQLEAEIGRTIEDSTTSRFAVLSVGLDRLEDVAEAFGIDYARRLMVEASNRIDKQSEDAVIVGRLGESRIGMLLRADAREATLIARRIAQAFELPFTLDELTIGLAGRVGIALHPAHTTDAAGLLARAEIAQRQTTPGNRVFMYEEGLDRTTADQLVLLGELQDAIGQDQLQLAYQPKMDLRSGKLKGFEALVRWNHPTRGPIPPSLFVPLVERAGNVTQLTRWVVRAASRQQSLWRAMGLDYPVAVNLSAQDLRETLPATLLDAISASDLPRDALGFEVTESALMSQYESAISCLGSLSAANIALSLDDFGTGQSALSYLRDLPVDELKIDRSFVQAACESERDRAILNAVAQLGSHLDMHVIGEGVETKEAADILEAAGAQSGQGYYWARPLDAAAVVPWIESGAEAFRRSA